jgi:hypothetical protein
MRAAISPGKPASEQNKVMPKITNSTIIKHATPICAALQKRGDNWSADAGAAVIVKTVLEEMGCVEQLGEDFKTDRAALIALVKPFLTASKNFQNSYLEPSGLMPKIAAADKVDNAEFA